MQLIGMLDSPYVRRVAISLKRLAIPFEHKSLSVFRDFDAFSQHNPVVKAPTLITDNGTVLMDSQTLRLIGLALMACDKTVQLVYERTLRPTDKQYQPWIERVTSQLHAAYAQIEHHANTLTCEPLMQPAITSAVAWRFTQLHVADIIPSTAYPQLAKFSDKAEALPEFISTPVK